MTDDQRPPFAEALDAFLAALEEHHRERFAREYPNVLPPTFEAMTGDRYVRIVQRDGTVSRSAWGFVERSTGAILKADGWKRPAKGARGSIYDPNPLASLTPEGRVVTHR